MATSGEMTAAGEMLKSAYELAREERIRRNQRIMQELGLIDAAASLRGSNSQAAPKQERKKRKNPDEVKHGHRKSRRLQNIPAANEPPTDISAGEDGEDSTPSSETLKARRIEDDKEIMKKYERLLKKHKECGVKIPETASYAHTVMRVRSCTEVRLVGRIKAIERACGVYAVVKMRMFAEVLILEGYDELTALAEAALQRLLLLPRFKGQASAEVYDIVKAQKGGSSFGSK
jgi:hypothetical protein